MCNIMEKGCVDHAVRGGCPSAQAFQVLNMTPVRLGAGVNERPGGCVRTSKPDHLMARADEFLDDGAADESRCPGDKYSHQ